MEQNRKSQTAKARKNLTYMEKSERAIFHGKRSDEAALSYGLGAIAGLIFGGIVGQLKNLFIWQRYLRKYDGAAGPDGAGGLYGRAMVSYFVNILTLAAVFFCRNIVPFSGIAFLIGTAVALTIMNKVLAVQQKKSEDRRKEV